MPVRNYTTNPDDFEDTVVGTRYGTVSTASTSTVVVRSTTYNEQTTNAQRSVGSASANDTAAGTGARTIRVVYYDQTLNGPYTEDITLNGTTKVNTVASNICFIEEVYVLTAGSGGVNAGIITLYVATAGGGGTIGTIAASENATRWAHHYVATDVTMRLVGVTAGADGGKTGQMFSEFTTNLTANAVGKRYDCTRLDGSNSTVQRTFAAALKFTGPGRFLLKITPDASQAANWVGGFDFYER